MRRLKWYKKISILTLLTILWACNQEPPDVIDDNGYFRGFRMGMAPDSLLAMEPWTPAQESDTLIVFNETMKIGKQDSEVKVYAAFDAYGLFEVQVDCFPNSQEGMEMIHEVWSNKLTDAFGESELVFAARRWTSYSLNNHLVEITLSNERDDEGRKFISLNYLEPLDDAY